MKNFKRTVVNKWLAVSVRANAAEIPDYEGHPDYDAEISIYDQIGEDYWGGSGVSAQDFKTQLDAFSGKKVLLCIHSPGGNVYDAMAMHNNVKEHGGVDTKVVGLAASAASALFQAGNNRIMSRFSMQMAHKASSLTIGNAQDMEKEAAVLQKHDETLAKLYAARSGKSVADCMAMMDAETWMDGDECKANGFCDELTDEEGESQDSVTNKKFDLSKFKNTPAKAAKFNVNKQKEKGEPSPQPKLIMNREEMISLLKSAGVVLNSNETDEQLKDLVKKHLKPVTANAAGDRGQADAAAPANQAVYIHPEIQTRIDALEKRANSEARVNIEARVNKCIENDQLPANKRDWLIQASLADKGTLEAIEGLPSKPPGFNAVTNFIPTETTDAKEVSKGIVRNRGALTGYIRRQYQGTTQLCEAIGEGAKANSRLCKQVVNNLCSKFPDSPGFEEKRREIIADFCEKARMNDSQQGPYGSVTVSSDLQQQVIMSESMRAFRRRLAPLESLAHKFNSVPLEGKDEIDVPYYPLFTTGSLRFTTATGYQFSGTDVENRRQIIVGGSGAAVKTPGVDRAYQPMLLSSYLYRRQPWVDAVKLSVMRGEQLAFDILNDIITAWILKANFGNSVWSGAPTAFDETSVAALQGVANKKDWPEQMRSLVIGTDYYTNLASSPYVKATYAIGDSGVIRQGRIGGLYGFDDTIGNPRIPVTADGDLVGWIAYPSAVLVATSPILPAPGVLHKLLSYDVITDDQIGLSFEYRYWGDEGLDTDKEVIECNYGSGLGELAALGRITAAGGL